MSICEILMMVCFGAAWPVSIYKSVKSGRNDGKSLYFMLIVFCGYVFGMGHKIWHNMDAVIWLYGFNCILVAVDICLYYVNFKKAKR